jgi:hypothetical protein
MRVPGYRHAFGHEIQAIGSALMGGRRQIRWAVGLVTRKNDDSSACRRGDRMSTRVAVLTPAARRLGAWSL